MKILTFVKSFLFIFCAMFFYITPLSAFIRDSEIENTLKIFCEPIFKSAGLAPKSVDFYIINNPALNAFVQGGLAIYLHTGLIVETKTPGQIIGVIAHETGHIQGGHAVGLRRAYEDSALQSIVGMAIGVAAAAISSDSKAGLAAAAITQEIAKRNLMQHSRAHENAADQAGLRLMTDSGYSAQGFLEVLKSLQNKALLQIADQYLLTHPLTEDRIQNVQNYIQKSGHSYKDFPSEWYEMHNRIRAKTIGFLYSYEDIIRNFPQKNESFSSAYAWVILFFRQGKLKEALSLVDELIQKNKNDGYLYELKGQILFESGRVQESVASYKRALQILPQASLIKLSYAHALIELNKNNMNQEASKILRQIEQYEKHNPEFWRLQSVAYGRLGEMGKAYLSLAEKAFLEGDLKAAEYQAERSQKMFTEYSKQWVQAQDILKQIKQRQKK